MTKDGFIRRNFQFEFLGISRDKWKGKPRFLENSLLGISVHLAFLRKFRLNGSSFRNSTICGFLGHVPNAITRFEIFGILG